MRKTQNPRNILYLVLSIVIAAGIWYYVDDKIVKIPDGDHRITDFAPHVEEIMSFIVE